MAQVRTEVVEFFSGGRNSGQTEKNLRSAPNPCDLPIAPTIETKRACLKMDQDCVKELKRLGRSYAAVFLNQIL